MSKFSIVDGNSTPAFFQTENLIKSAGITDNQTYNMLLSKTTLISRLFPSAQQRVINDFKMAAVKESADFYLRLCRLTHDAQMNAFTERFNAALLTYVGELRAEVVRFARAKFSEVQNMMNEVQDRDIRKLEQIYKSIQGISVKSYKDRYENNLSQQVDMTFDFQMKLLDEFVDFLNKKLSIPDHIINTIAR